MPGNERNNSITNRSAYYAQCKALAREKRIEYEVETASLNILVMQKIYKKEGITLDRRPLRSNRIRAAYYCEDGECSVLLKVGLPLEPKLFALAHELKHHYLDQDQIQEGRIQCGDYNAQEVIEIGGEVFAAEFIYPELEMRQLISQMGITSLTCTKEKVVEFKRACPAHVSYIFIVKRFERFGLCPRGAFQKIQFKKLEEELFGLPIYKQEWFKQHRSRKKSSKSKHDSSRTIIRK
jgi:Zn-dependent peptidase ImmA (M78 family)